MSQSNLVLDAQGILGREDPRQRGQRRKLYAHKVEASQEIGTRMVNEAQIEIAAFASQNSGGPLNVTKILAAIDTNVSEIRASAKV
jgi:hypothetical protein